MASISLAAAFWLGLHLIVAGPLRPRLVGMAPFGSLIAGWSADRIGAPRVSAIGGFFCALAGVVFARQLPKLR